jgi:hypothetical protein
MAGRPLRMIRPGDGELLCQWPAGCRLHEIEGMEFCLVHVPDDMLDEAEEITRTRRCRKGFGEPGACRNVAVNGTEPARCKVHGANLGGVISKQASKRVVEGRVQDRMAQIMSERGDRLMNPPPIGNPLVELMTLAAEIGEWKQIMKEIVIYLLDADRIRSAHNRVGEQLRAEVLLFERAQERYAQILERIAKLGIEARLAAIEERQVLVVEQALTAALTASGLDVYGQDEARKVLRRELRKAAG